MLSPFYDFPFDSLTREMARQLDRAARARVHEERAESLATFPKYDLFEKDDSYVFACELPGVALEDVSLTIDGNVVSIAAKREVAAPEGFTARVRERTGFAFDRSFKLGTRIDSNAAEAKLENGVLTLTLPKAKKNEPLKIAVTRS
jgi:HSP20 family protein